MDYSLDAEAEADIMLLLSHVDVVLHSQSLSQAVQPASQPVSQHSITVSWLDDN